MKNTILIIVGLLFTFSCSNKNRTEKEITIFDIVKSNNIDSVKIFIDKNGINLDTVDNSGFTPLVYAIQNQNLDLVEILISRGATVDFCKTKTQSPFYIALNLKSIDKFKDNFGHDISTKERILKFLLKNGVEIDENTYYGKSLLPLMRDIDNYHIRSFAFSKVIKDTVEIRRQKLDSIRRAKEWEERRKKYKQERKIRLVNNPNIRRKNNSITFDVADVELAKKSVKEKSYMWAIQSRPVKRIEYCNKETYSIIPTYRHPFVKAVEYAYADHRPLILSPDIVWLLICQGFSKHIEVNSAKFRDRIVDFQGKKRIDVRRNDFVRGQIDSLWQGVIKEFAEKTKRNIVDTSLYSTIVHSFSTTTDKELIAFDITFLEINRHYFDYTFWACGIPEITLEGTTADWVWIRENIEVLKDYELDWWCDKLIPIIDEFVNASKENIDLKFWSEIYRKDQFCNHEITGWFTNFFPYIRKGSKLLKNPLLFKEPVYNEEMMFFEGAIENENFPSGLSIADFRFIDRDSSVTNLSFVAGFVGIKQDKKTKALKPEINWLITD